MDAANIDIEDATQHLRDILKLDRPGGENQRPSCSYNGDLNGLLVPDPLAAGDCIALTKPVSQPVPVGTLQEKQVICLSGDDSSTCVVITAKDVEIVASSDSSITSKARGSNKVKIQPVARYDWEQKYYYGNLIAVSNAYLAYAIRGASNGSAMVRVLSVSTAERTLLKGFTGGVADLAFAHLNSSQLACLDEAGNLFVWRLTMESGKIQEEILVNIKRPESTPLNSFRRIIWCPFIPDENDDSCEEGSQTLALLHEDRAEVWDLDIIRANHSSWPVEVTNIKEGFIVVKAILFFSFPVPFQRLSEGALAPDGTVLATASHDGYVKFWQIYIEGQDEPRCLHEWKPHDGRPLSCLLFCDNHKKQDPEVPFWRFLITGADQNRELKMWCTVSWTCLQTVRFSPDIFSSMSVLPSLKACLDLSAEYLILSDVQRKVSLVQNQEEGKAYFSSISEFLLTHPVLSFGIQAVSRCRLRHTEVLPAEEESDGLNAEGTQGTGAVESAAGVLIKLFCVHTKALQDVQIRFQPLHSPDTAAPMPPHGSHEDFAFPDHLADLGTEGLGLEKGSVYGSQPDLRRVSELSVPIDFLPPSNEAKPKLMTPDAFMTPSTSLQQVSQYHLGSSISSLTSVTAMSSSVVSDPPIPRSSEDVSLSPKMQLDASLGLSGSAGSLQTSPRSHSVHLSNLPDKLPPKAPVPVSSGNAPHALERKEVEPLMMAQSSPTRERSPDVISSASTAMSQDIPEIASETLQRGFGTGSSGHDAENMDTNHHEDSMASAASALHLLSPHNRHNTEHSHHSLDVAPNEVDMLVAPSLLETALPQETAVVEAGVSQPWPAAPDITRETRNSMADSPRNEPEEKHKGSYHRHTYHMLQHESQDGSAEQSDHDDEVASLASASGGFSAKAAAQRIPVKDWKAKVSPRNSPKLKRKGKKEDGYLEEAVMHLDQSDPITRDHMGSVMSQVRQKLFQFLQTDPHNSLSKPARRLTIMLQGLVTPSMS
ncbi:hypothetical protein JRQ81_006277 [Phrynocephalus forsythii]|uniref:Enhancer of mRNA-decapping protein 4 n=1 Tax=Phrynocephalus forsythii TaxID=171643 RepID=A0A9Q1AUE6_9SAUR|nr:hypothetical protein JRQ81_006277 [Phrynocephalus forsythii]